MSLVIDGRDVELPTMVTTSYRQNSKLKLIPGHSMRARHTRWIRSIVLHNTKNIATHVKPGAGPFRNVGERVASYWSTEPSPAGAHIIVDWDGSIWCLADLVQDATYHASSMNEVSIGIEIFEDEHGTVYEIQIERTAELVVWLCERFRIQKQCPEPSNNEQILRIQKGGMDCVGVFGHCHQWHAGKANDPSTHIFEALCNRKFRNFNFRTDTVSHTPPDDITYWASIQENLGVYNDGIPGPSTCDALQAQGYAHGLYPNVSTSPTR